MASNALFIDGRGARLLAGLVALGAVAGLVLYNWELLLPAPPAQVAVSGPPELIACLKERLGSVDKMQADGVITAAQHTDFGSRAESFCYGRFGEGGPPAAPQ